MQGELLFKGQKSLPIPVEIGDQEREFDALLQDYLKRGYSAASGCLVGTRGYAIGFVMTIYRKLAASSYAAIAAALEKPGRAMSKPMTAAIAFSRLLKAILDSLCS